MTPQTDGIEPTTDVHNGHATPHVEDGNDDSIIVPTDDTNQDVFAQWDALLQRESHPTYTQHEPLPTFVIHPRSILAKEFFSIVDYYNIDRSTISIALSYLDRLTSHGIIEHAELACAGFTCFYLAVKLNSYSGKKFHMAQLVKLSRGIISSVESIADMESHVCEVLDWYLNDVIPVMYVDVITPLLLKDSSMRSMNADEDQECGGSSSSIGEMIPPESKEELIETARYLCELSTMDAFFSSKRPSSIAYASVLVAMDILQFSPTASKWFVSLPLDHDPEETEVCIQCLHEMYPREDAEEEKLPCATSSDDDCNDQTKGGVDENCRAVTPLKGDVSPLGTKRVHQDMALESYGCQNDRDGCSVELSPKRTRAQ